jgi:hypothetical protein
LFVSYTFRPFCASVLLAVPQTTELNYRIELHNVTKDFSLIEGVEIVLKHPSTTKFHIYGKHFSKKSNPNENLFDGLPNAHFIEFHCVDLLGLLPKNWMSQQWKECGCRKATQWWQTS